MIFGWKSGYYTDMKRFLFVFWQCTWGFLQTLCGFVVFLLNVKEKHYWYHNAIATEWDKDYGVSLGLFIFGWKDSEDVMMHEYGHSIQSLVLGPLYFIIIGIPSALWANLGREFRKRNHVDYSAFYPEKYADRLGARVVKGRKI